MHNQLIDKTIQILRKTTQNGSSLYNILTSSYDQKYGTWGAGSSKIVEEALDKAAKTLSKEVLIEEYNYLAACYDCDEIEEWDYESQTMELEMFIDEVFEKMATRFSNENLNPKGPSC